MIPASPEFINAMKKPIVETYIKLEFYDKSMNFVSEFTKKCTRDDFGAISVQRDRKIMRSFSFALDNSDGTFTWSDSSLVWINKRLKVYTGLKTSNGIEYVPQGVFVLTEPSDSNNEEGQKCFITGQDKAYLYNDKRGKIINPLEIEEGVNVGTAIKLLATQNGETLFNFDAVTATVPYKLNYQAGENRWTIMEELALFAECVIYFDVNGYLRLKKIDLNEFTEYGVTWIYQYGVNTEKFYSGNIRKLDEQLLANKIVVLAGSAQTAIASYILTVDDTDPLWTGSPYSIQELGVIPYLHNNGSPDPLLDSDSCKWRAKWELMNRLGYSERVSLRIVPNYLHEVYDVIQIEDNKNNVTGRYLMEGFDIPINPDYMNTEVRKENRIILDWDFI